MIHNALGEIKFRLKTLLLQLHYNGCMVNELVRYTVEVITRLRNCIAFCVFKCIVVTQFSHDCFVK